MIQLKAPGPLNRPKVTPWFQTSTKFSTGSSFQKMAVLQMQPVQDPVFAELVGRQHECQQG